ncbi:MAG: TetR/AcrR family transcriptional regulator [Rhizobiaceae bacterium]|nr:TetR/AcrR family transcriptional regulator [Rhizobiaceae bacterium]
MVDDVVVLHRDDPDKDPLVGHVKVTRQDWINVARHILVSEGISQVKILTISERLEVSRSSFYWYFESRNDLLDALLDEWENRNTATIVKNCGMKASGIGAAMCNFFRCFIDPELFDRGLDFAVREWSRRDTDVRNRIDKADEGRLTAIIQMFEAHGYGSYEADCRARILYFMQLGYHALDVNETMEVRMSRLQGYLDGFSGREIAPEEYQALVDFAYEKGGN